MFGMKKTAFYAAAVAALVLAACGPKTEPASSNNNAVHNDTKGVTASHDMKPGKVDPLGVPMDTKIRASRGLKNEVYSNAIGAVFAPEDKKEHSAYSEYGWKGSMDYKTYGNFPAGWWVYSEPYWVIWELKNGKPGQ
jgi:hypothetical protein